MFVYLMGRGGTIRFRVLSRFLVLFAFFYQSLVSAAPFVFVHTSGKYFSMLGRTPEPAGTKVLDIEIFVVTGNVTIK